MKRDRKAGLTLVEVLITLALFALLMTMVSTALINCLRYYKKGVEMSKLRTKASTILNVLSSDIAKANAIYSPWYPTAPDSNRLCLWVPDIYANEDDLTSGGDLHVYYEFYPSMKGSLRRITRYDDVIVAEGIKSIRYSTSDATTSAVTIYLTVAKDVNDPNSATYTISTAICRRGTMPMWEFGP